jgi:hypothetical protein
LDSNDAPQRAAAALAALETSEGRRVHLLAGSGYGAEVVSGTLFVPDELRVRLMLRAAGLDQQE